MAPTQDLRGKMASRDSAALFTSDTLKGGAKKPELAKFLCENSGTDVEWLMNKFNLDLSLVGSSLRSFCSPNPTEARNVSPA